MHWRALLLLVVALSVFAPFVGDSRAAGESSCCAEMQACAGHCDCPVNQTCKVSKPAPVDQQILARTTAVSPRVEVELFTLKLASFSALKMDREALGLFSTAPMLDTSQKPQARLCLWLI